MLGNLCLQCSVFVSLSLISFKEGSAATGDDDYVPRFFGGRRNEENDSGMGPPRPRLKLRSSTQVETFYFPQRLDHFSDDKAIWDQRYTVNAEFFDPKSRISPKIFIRIGGESTIDPSDLLYGPWVELARKHQGLLVELEHRFYGESRPTSDVSTRNLRYLSSRQAIEDLDNFIMELKAEYWKCKEPKIILYGCSYAGSLAVWHRMLHPTHTQGAIASCAPLEADPFMWGKVAYRSKFAPHLALDVALGFASQITRILRRYDCESVMAKTFRTFALDEEGKSSRKPDPALRNYLRLCDIQTGKEEEMLSFLYELSARLMREVQYDKKNSNTSTIATLCKMLRDAEPYKTTTPIYYVNGISSTDLDRSRSYELVEQFARQWIYQMCSEFGFFIVLSFQNLGFGIDRYSKKTCQDSFNITDNQVWRNTQRTNEAYGGQRKLNATNLYLLNGNNDPWIATMHSTSGNVKLNNKLLKNVVVRVVQDMSHCEEPIGREGESKELSKAWEDIDKKISKWIMDF